MKKKSIILSLFLVFITFYTFSQSRIPELSTLYVTNGYPDTWGDRDQVSVFFFEVPDSITSTLYFHVYDAASDDSGIDQGSDNSTFYLIGGTGALSDAKSQQGTFPTQADALVGTTLSNFTSDYTLAAYNDNWYPFPQGVQPSQGEHIGNKYYFKVAVVSPRAGTYKNGYQIDLSYSSTGAPTGIPDVNSFTFNYTITLLRDSSVSHAIYPFIPDSANATSTVDTDFVMFGNRDAVETNNTITIGSTSKTGKNIETIGGPIAQSASGTTSETFYNLFDINADTVVTEERNGTWTYTVTEGGGTGTLKSMQEHWMYLDDDTISDEGDEKPIRLYFSPNTTPLAADSVLITSEDATAIADDTDTEQITLQIIDNTGEPANYSRDLYVNLTDGDTNPAQIVSINGVAYGPATNGIVATDDFGLGFYEIRRDVNADADTLDNFVVRSDIYWDTTGSSDTFGTATSDFIDVTFFENPDPTISSLNNMSFDVGDAFTAIGTITIDHPSQTLDPKIKDDGAGLNELQIRIPSTLDAEFRPAATEGLVVTGSGSVVASVSYSGDFKTLYVEVDGDFVNGDSLDITGLELQTFGSASAGSLELSWDSGVTFSAIDDKSFSINDPTLDYIWTGATDSDWDVGSNWSPAGPPADSSGFNIYIPTTSQDPVLSSDVDVAELTISNGAQLTTGTNSILSTDLSVNGTLDASGQTGVESVTVTGNLILSGTYSGGAGAFSVTGTSSLASDIITSDGDITLTGAVTLTADSQLSTGAAGGDITLSNQVDGAFILTLDNADTTSSVIMGGAVGSTTPLTSLLINTGTFASIPEINATTLEILLTEATADINVATAGNTISNFSAAVAGTGNSIALPNNDTTLTIPSTGTVAGNLTATDGIINIQNTGIISIEGNINAGAGTVTIDTLGNNAIGRTGAVAVTASTINLQTASPSEGLIGGFASPVLTSGTTSLNLGQVAEPVNGAYISHTGNLTLATIYEDLDDPVSIISSGNLVLPALAINTGLSDLTLSSSGAFSTAADLTTSSGNISITATTFTVANTVSTTSGTFDMTGNITGAGTLTAGSGDVNIDGDFSVATFTASTGNTTIDGNVTFSAFNNNGGILILDDSGVGTTFTTGGVTLNDLQLTTGTDSTVLSGILNVSGNLFIDANNTLDGATNGPAINVTGNVTGTGVLTGGAGNIDVDGNVTVSTITASTATTTVGGNLTSTTFTPNGGLLVLDTLNSSTVSSTSFADLEIQDTITQAADWIISGTLTITSGSLTTSTNSLSAATITIATNLIATAQVNGADTLSVTGNVTGAGSLTGGPGAIDVDGNVTVSTFTASTGMTSVGGDLTSTTFTPNGGLLVLDNVNSSTISPTAFADLEIQDTITQSADWTVSGSLTVTSGSLTTSTNSLSAASTAIITNLIASAQVNGADTLAVTGNVTGAGTLLGGAGNIDIDGNTTVTNFTASSVQTNIGGNFSSALTHSGGLVVLDNTAGSTLAATGSFNNLQVSANKQLGTDLTVIGTLTIDNPFTFTSNINSLSTASLVSNGTLEASSQTAAETLIVTSNASGTGTLTGGDGDIDVDGNLTITTVTASTGTTNVGGDLTLTTFSDNGGDLILNSNSAGTTFTTNAQTLNNLQLSTGTDTTVVSGALNISGNLIIDLNNTLDANTNSVAISVTGDLSNAGTLDASSTTTTVQKDWSNTGTFTHNNGLVTLGGNSGTTLTHDTDPFYNLTTVTDSYIIGTVLNVDNDLILTTGGDLAANGGLTIVNDFIISNAGSIFSGTGTVDITGATGDLLVSAGSYTGNGALAVSSGNVNISGSGIYSTLAAGDAILTAGDFTYSSSGTSTVAGDITFSGADGDLSVSSGTFTANGAVNLNGVTSDLTVSGGTFNGSGALDIEGNVVLGPGTLTGTGRSINVAGDWDQSGGTYTAGVATVTFDGTAPSVTTIDDFYDVTIIGSATLSTDIVVAGDLAITGGTFDGNGRQINIAGNWTNTGTFTHGGNLVVFDGGATSTLTAGASAFNNLTVTGGTTVNASTNPITISGTLITAAGTDIFDAANLNLTIATLNNTGTVRLTGEQAVQSITTMDTNSGLVEYYNGAANGTVRIPDFFNITINGTGRTFSLNGLTTVSGDLILNNGNLSAGVNNLTISGNFDSSGGGTFTSGTAQVIFNGLDTTLNSTETFNDIRINKTAIANTLTLLSTLDINGDLLIDQGTLVDNGQAINEAGDFTVNANGRLTSTGSVIFDGTTIFADISPGISFTSGQLAGGSSLNTNNDLTFTDAFSVGGAASSLNISGYTLSTGGNFNLTNLTTFTDDATSSVTISGTSSFTSAGIVTIDNVNIAAGAGTVTLQDSLTLEGNLTLTSGTLASGANNITLPGNWTNAGGSFSSSGNVTLNGGGTSIISGSTTFNDFTCVTAGQVLQFVAGTTQTMAGNMTIAGADGNLIQMISSIGGSQWTLNMTGTSSVSYVYIQDGGVLVNDIIPTFATNGGNNDVPSPGWDFPPVIWDGTTNTDWGTGSNWNTGTVPQQWDDVLIANAGALPATLDGARTVTDLTINPSATVDIALAANILTISGTYDNNGTLYRVGGDSVSQTDINTGSVVYRTAGGAIQEYAGTDYFNLEINQAGQTYSIGSALGVAGDLTNSAGTLDFSGQTVNITGSLGNTGTLTTGVSVITVQTNWTNSGTFNSVGSTVNLGGGTPGPHAVASTGTFNDLNIASDDYSSAAALVIAGILDISSASLTHSAGVLSSGVVTLTGGDLAITGGSLSVTTGDLTISNAGSDLTGSGAVGTTTGGLNISAGTYTGSGNLTIAASATLSGGTFSPTGTTGITGDLLVTGGVASTLTNTLSAINANFTGAGSVMASNTMTLSGNLSMIDGTFDGTGAIDITGDVILSNLNASLDGTGRTISVAGDWDETANVFTAGTGSVVFNGISPGISSINMFNDVTIDGAVTLSNAINIDGNLVLTSGSLTSGANAINLAANVTRTGGNINSSDTVIFDGAGTQFFSANSSLLNDVTVMGASTLEVFTGPVNITGTLTIDDTADSVDMNNHDFTIGTLSFNGNAGSFLLDGTQVTQTVTTMDVISGSVEYNGASGGNVILTDFFTLNINRAGQTFVLNNNINISGDLNLALGALNANSRTIRLQGDFNTTGGTFTPGTSTVQFIGITDSAVNGNNSFYNLVCNVISEPTVVGGVGKILIIEASSTQTILSSGTLDILGTNTTPATPPVVGWPAPATTYITLRSSVMSGGNEWTLNLIGGSTLSMQYADIWYSNAVPAINVPADVETHNCIDWLLQIYITDSYTRDTNSNGKIDIIEVVVPVNLDDEFGDAGSGSLSIDVNGYSVINIDTGLTANDRVFWINLAEGIDFDTDARPTWSITNSGSLRDDAIGIYQISHLAPAPPETARDDADPIITHILTMPGQNDIFVQFSETVYRTGGTAILSGDIATAGTLPGVSSVAPITGNAPGSQELLITLAGPVPIIDIFNNSLLTFSNLDDNAAVISAIVPVWAGLPTAPNTFIDNTHRVSDLALGQTGNGIIQPVYATDEAVTDEDRGGIGLIKDFTGNAWLQDENIEITTHINSSYAATTADPIINFVFDVDVTTGLRQDGLDDGIWLPSGYNATFKFYMVPAPDSGSTSIATDSTPSDFLRTHVLDSSHPDIKSESLLDFLYYLPAEDLYAARIEDSSATDWYRQIKPWSFDIHDITTQVGGVTILNNVINPENGETTNLHYELKKTGMVTIQVFDISGAMVDVLKRGRMDAGEYSTAWDGRNSGGRVVARGVYFLRIVAPDLDETRKVMVVK